MSYTIIIFLLCGSAIVYNLFKIDYKDLSWKKNKDHYCNLFAMVCSMLAVLCSFFDNKGVNF